MSYREEERRRRNFVLAELKNHDDWPCQYCRDFNHCEATGQKCERWAEWFKCAWKNMQKNSTKQQQETNAEINIFDEREIHTNCTVEIWHNSITDEHSIGWWKNGQDDTACGGDSTDTDTGSK